MQDHQHYLSRPDLDASNVYRSTNSYVARRGFVAWACSWGPGMCLQSCVYRMTITYVVRVMYGKLLLKLNMRAAQSHYSHVSASDQHHMLSSTSHRSSARPGRCHIDTIVVQYIHIHFLHPSFIQR